MLSIDCVRIISATLGILALSEGKIIDDLRSGMKIINGFQVKPGEIPFQVSLQYKDIYYHFCGGSIINQYFVLTAAHCFEAHTAATVKVVAGTTNLLEKPSIHNVTKVFVHAGYNYEDSVVHDIALLKVDPPFRYSRYLYPAQLPNPQIPAYAGDEAVVSGWGLTHKNDYPHNLQKAEVFIADDEYCYDIYNQVHFTIYSSQICAHEPTTEKGSCIGDSGGPLTVDNVLVGIVSWAYDCASIDYPTVFTRVSYYVDWILQHIEENMPK